MAALASDSDQELREKLQNLARVGNEEQEQFILQERAPAPWLAADVAKAPDFLRV